MNLPTNTWLLQKLARDFKAIHFIAADNFIWSPSRQTLYFDEKKITDPEGQWTLLHELGHGLLQHDRYRSDIELLYLESAAWQKAQELGDQYGVQIDQIFVQEMLDTYRQWLTARSTCPKCQQTGVQKNRGAYCCFNCRHLWKVPQSRLCIVRRYAEL